LIRCFLQVIAATMLNRFSLVATVLVAAALSASPALAASGPIGVWKLDEGHGTTVADSSGNGNNGVLSGGVSWVAGVFGPGLAFDGQSGQVKVADNAALEPADTVTVSAWFKNDGSPGSYRYILAKGTRGCTAASYGLYTGPNGGLQFYVSRQRGAVYTRSPDAGQGIWDGQWHLAVGTYDGSNVRLYIDGVQVGSGTAWSGTLEYLLPSSNDFYIGNYPGCQPRWFLGDIDDVDVWDRALSAGDVKALMPTSTAPPTTGAGGSGGSGGGTGSGPGGSGAGSGGSGGSGGDGTSKDRPSIHDLRLSTSSVTVNSHGQIIAQGASGLSLTYTESEAAQLTVTLLRSETGVRRGDRCVAPPRHHHGRLRRCTRYVVISTLVHSDRAGRLTVHLNQLLHGKLTPGSYRLDVTPRADGKVGRTVHLRFVVRRAHAHR
jgi:hypothetical protein